MISGDSGTNGDERQVGAVVRDSCRGEGIVVMRKEMRRGTGGGGDEIEVSV